MRRLILSSTAFLMLAAFSPSTAGAPSSIGGVEANQCFRPSMARNFTVPNDQTLYVRAPNADVFQINAAACRDMTHSLSIALNPVGSSSRLCVGDQATLASASTGVVPCRVNVSKKLTAEEIAALPSRDRP
jgi:hypothetical protein